MANAIMEKMSALLDEYNHINDINVGIKREYDVCLANKANLIEHFSKHPNWDAENLRIVFSADYERGFEKEAIVDFKRWFCKEFLKARAQKIGTLDAATYGANIDRLESIQCQINRIRGREDTEGFNFQSYMVFKYEGEEYSTLTQLICSMKNVFNQFEEKYVRVCGVYITEEDKNEIDKIIEFFNKLINTAETNLLTEEQVETISQLYPELHAVVGQKIMKPIRKLCIMYGLDKVVSMETERFLDDNDVEHVRTRDKGFNYQIAQLGDRVNPLKIKRHTIISLNPNDYYTMSFLHKTASCHTIDKENKRNVSNHYSGMYCSGTLSYMLDSSSVVFYTVDERYNGTEFETQDKMQRCMFHINEDGTVLLQGRVYPDGRDGGEQSYASQFRNIMQKIVAECWGYNNLWTLKKGTGACCDFSYSRGTHYRDYANYDDCTVSLLNGVLDHKKVHIGHRPICPNCGEEHDEEDNLTCRSCRNEECCPTCGDPIDPHECVICYDTDIRYCSYECAERDGAHYCEDDGVVHDEDHCYYDDGSSVWYSGDPEVTTEDGLHFHSYDAAEENGYMMTDDGEWYREDEVYYDENREIYFHEWSGMIGHNGDYYCNSTSAQEAGLIEHNGEWYSEDEMVSDARTGELFPSELDSAVQIGDEWYIDDFSAREAGYALDDNGEWRREAA